MYLCMISYNISISTHHVGLYPLAIGTASFVHVLSLRIIVCTLWYTSTYTHTVTDTDIDTQTETDTHTSAQNNHCKLVGHSFKIGILFRQSIGFPIGNVK